MGDAIPPKAENKLEDLSGIVLSPGENPYSAFIKACNNDHVCWCLFLLYFVKELNVNKYWCV